MYTGTHAITLAHLLTHTPIVLTHSHTCSHKMYLTIHNYDSISVIGTDTLRCQSFNSNNHFVLPVL